MVIDYNDYVKMDIQELKKNIDMATNVLKAHEEQELEAVKNQSAPDLLKTFEHNPSRKLSQGAWDFMNIMYLEFEQIDFLELVISLPEFETQNKRKQLNQSPDWLENCVKENMVALDFIDYFYNHPLFSPILKNLIHLDSHINATISQDVIQFMVDKNLITIDENYLKNVRKKDNVSINHQIYGYTPYIEYGLKNEIIKASSSEIKDLYELYWPQMSQRFKEYLREEYKEVRDISFNKMLSSGHYAGKDDLTEKRKLEYLTYYEPANFQATIKTHYLDDQDIVSLCKVLQGEVSFNVSQEQEQRIFTHITSLLRLIKEDYPMKWDVAENALMNKAFGKFKENAKKVLLYVKMEHEFNLQSNDDNSVSDVTNSSNKLKI